MDITQEKHFMIFKQGTKAIDEKKLKVGILVEYKEVNGIWKNGWKNLNK